MKIKLKSFPKEVLPPFLDSIINNYLGETVGMYEYLASSMLTTYGSTIANDYEVRRGNWVERPNLWLMYVANSGKGKSHQLDDVTMALKVKDEELSKKYKVALAQKNETEKNIKELNAQQKKDKETITNIFKSVYGLTNYFETLNIYNNKGNLNSLEIPKLRLLNNRFTFPSFLRQLENNKGKNITILVDEAKNLFDSMNNYSSGDEETFLEFFNYGSLNVERKDEELSSYIENKTISIICNTQPKVIGNIFNEKRKVNGNLYRWLFVVNNDDTPTNPFDIHIINGASLNLFTEICTRNLRMWEGEPARKTFSMTKDINDVLKNWRIKMNKKYRENMDTDEYDSIMGKMDSYIIRIAIILNRLWFEEKIINNLPLDVNFRMTIEDFLRAGELVEWYFLEHLKATRQTESILNQYLTEDEINKVYNLLNPSFKWKDFIDGMNNINVKSGAAEYKLKKMLNTKIVKYNEQKREYIKLIY